MQMKLLFPKSMKFINILILILLSFSSCKRDITGKYVAKFDNGDKEKPYRFYPGTENTGEPEINSA